MHIVGGQNGRNERGCGVEVLGLQREKEDAMDMLDTIEEVMVATTQIVNVVSFLLCTIVQQSKAAIGSPPSRSAITMGARSLISTAVAVIRACHGTTVSAQGPSAIIVAAPPLPARCTTAASANSCSVL